MLVPSSFILPSCLTSLCPSPFSCVQHITTGYREVEGEIEREIEDDEGVRRRNNEDSSSLWFDSTGSFSGFCFVTSCCDWSAFRLLLPLLLLNRWCLAFGLAVLEAAGGVWTLAFPFWLVGFFRFSLLTSGLWFFPGCSDDCSSGFFFFFFTGSGFWFSGCGPGLRRTATGYGVVWCY